MIIDIVKNLPPKIKMSKRKNITFMCGSSFHSSGLYIIQRGNEVKATEGENQLKDKYIKRKIFFD